MRLRFSTWVAAGVTVAGALLLVAGLLLGRTSDSGKTVITVRLWDEQVAAAYRQSFAEFSRRHPDIAVRVNVVAYANYFTTLRTDVAGGGADDIFWLSNAYFAGYADNGKLTPIVPSPDWDAATIAQFTRNGTLWGVPQLTDAGIAVYYNADLLQAAGVDPATLDGLRWSPGADDTLRQLLVRLTVDQSGNRPDSPAFDPRRIRQWGYNAANDMQGIYLNFIGSAGGSFADGDRFTFANDAAARAFAYLVRLINTDHVAPSAADTNGNGDFSRNQFLAGRMALFQSGTYNLATVATQAPFRWGVAMLPIGPAGRVSVTNGIAAAANSATRHPAAVREVLAWMGSREGNAFLGVDGAAVPAVLSAQPVYFEHWRRRGVDVGPFFSVLNGPRIEAPGGAGFAAGYQALQPYFDEMFLGRLAVPDALTQAERAANTAAAR
ncbi:periplasmic sugar-binding lipoprotein uspC [Mycolicibacterium canariasense]|uniref:Periplasmic sugar-binding lipoprotein uspC n=1 Tax=Mycolicibacterium canariasense TaxID=228230 RepID=A0A124E1K7_MYCCR|nr:extracellular solute-binding protein [Mycolicibacterium canariasense]MCV7213173.1 extracellular solute-binding protein [Mycolicibacterium canariasense]ORV00879.1 sugar ABC transporter substrate-binding protein [Mycolicibacterium canariasense]GAS93994.1 periplasmic sugar-binding lipoprotein uspC [Mycolicibacterium canariasense]